jgi:hypothetical protein
MGREENHRGRKLDWRRSDAPDEIGALAEAFHGFACRVFELRENADEFP